MSPFHTQSPYAHPFLPLHTLSLLLEFLSPLWPLEECLGTFKVPPLGADFQMPSSVLLPRSGLSWPITGQSLYCSGS